LQQPLHSLFVTQQATASEIHKDKMKLQNTVRQLETDLSMIQKCLQIEKSTVAAAVSRTEAMANRHDDVGVTTSAEARGTVTDEAYADLEAAYEELHTKFEQLWEERRVACKKASVLQKERDQALLCQVSSLVRPDRRQEVREEDLDLQMLLEDASSEEEYGYDDSYEDDSYD
jgi:hypothetical protein